MTRTGARRRDDGEEAEERARGEAFHSLREYVPGDPPKLIHWRASARSGTLIVRRTVDTTVPWLLVILDVNERAYDRPGALFADFDSAAFEDAVDDAASWSWHGCGPEQRVLLTTTAASGMALDPVEVSARTRDRALDALALVEPVAPEACGPGVPQALLRSQGVARAVFITGHRRETSRAWLASWRRTSIVTVIGAPG